MLEWIVVHYTTLAHSYSHTQFKLNKTTIISTLHTFSFILSMNKRDCYGKTCAKTVPLFYIYPFNFYSMLFIIFLLCLVFFPRKFYYWIMFAGLRWRCCSILECANAVKRSDRCFIPQNTVYTLYFHRKMAIIVVFFFWFESFIFAAIV